MLDNFKFNNNLQATHNLSRMSSINPNNISNIRNRGINVIHNVYQYKYKYGIASTGLGDFIRGSYFILEFCKLYNFKPKIIFNHSQVDGNPELRILVEFAPDGRIINKRITKASGEVSWDNAVIKALNQVDSVPKDKNGNIPRQVNFIFKPKD